MNFLEQRIIKDGIVTPGDILKVDSFLNHQLDMDLIDQIGKEFHRVLRHPHRLQRGPGIWRSGGGCKAVQVR